MKKLPPIEEVPFNRIPEDLRLLILSGRVFPTTRMYMMGNCTIFCSTDVNGTYQMSITHPRRQPTWEEVKKARHELVPQDRTMAMLLPPMDQQGNNDNMLKLYEMYDPSHKPASSKAEAPAEPEDDGEDPFALIYGGG